MIRYLKKNEHYTKQMSNKEFYEKILEYEEEGLLVFTPSKGFSWRGFIKIPIGKRTIAIHNDISQFAGEMITKMKDNQFFTQQTLEGYIKKTAPVVMRLVLEGEYIRIKRSITKFYIKKDWE